MSLRTIAATPLGALGEDALDDGLGLVHAPEAREPPARLALQELRVGPHPEAIGLAPALERQGRRLLQAPLLVEALAEVHVRPPDAVVVGDLFGDPLGLAQHALGARPVAVPEPRDAEAVERVALERARADGARDRDRALAGQALLLAGGAEHPDLGLGREHARERGRRRVGRQHTHGVAVGGQGAVAVACQPQVAAEALACQRGGDHVAGGVGQLDRHAAEGDRAVVLARDEHALCRVGRHGRQAELGALVGVLDELPDLQRPLEVLSGLGEGEDLLGLQPGAHIGRQGLGQPVGGTPVVRQLGGGRPTAEAGVLARAPRRATGAARSARPGAGPRRAPPASGRGGRRSRRRRRRGRGGRPRRAARRDQLGLGQSARPPRAADGPTAGRPRRPRAAPRCASSGSTSSADDQRRRAGRRQRARRRRRRPRAAPRRRRRCPPARMQVRRRGWIGRRPEDAGQLLGDLGRAEAAELRRSTPPRRSSSARNGRSGWRRCSSSVR